jgi:hypothetical protein
MGFDPSPVYLYEMTNYRQTQTEAAVFARAGAVGLAESLKYKGQELGADPLPGVCNR